VGVGVGVGVGVRVRARVRVYMHVHLRVRVHLRVGARVRARVRARACVRVRVCVFVLPGYFATCQGSFDRIEVDLSAHPASSFRVICVLSILIFSYVLLSLSSCPIRTPCTASPARWDSAHIYESCRTCKSVMPRVKLNTFMEIQGRGSIVVRLLVWV